MSIELELQIATSAKTIPHPSQFREWIANTLSEHLEDAELTIRIVDEPEMTELNEKFRHKKGPTNVLSFPYDIDEQFEYPLLGDIVICAPVVQREAEDADIGLLAHWAHMVVHGTLHLLGYDHMQKDEAEIMENIETKILTDMGYPAPYGDAIPHG